MNLHEGYSWSTGSDRKDIEDLRHLIENLTERIIKLETKVGKLEQTVKVLENDDGMIG